MENYPHPQHTRTKRTHLSIKHFKIVADILFTGRLKAFPIARRINLPEDSGTADAYCGKILNSSKKIISGLQLLKIIEL